MRGGEVAKKSRHRRRASFRVGGPCHPGAALLLAAALFAGCAKNLGVSDMQLIEDGVPQRFELRLDPSTLWELVVKESRMYGDCGILANSPEDRVISWCESVVLWRDLRQDSVSSTSSNRGQQELARRAALREVGRGVALTTAWVRSAGNGSELTVRRVYFSPESIGGVAPSRGIYELDLYRRIQATPSAQAYLPAREAGATEGYAAEKEWGDLLEE